jgi:hypothetical protein
MILSFFLKDITRFSQYQLIVDVLKDKNFKGNVYKETGGSNNYKRINQFLLNPI